MPRGICVFYESILKVYKLQKTHYTLLIFLFIIPMIEINEPNGKGA